MEQKRNFSSMGQDQYREFNRLSDDSCYISQKDAGNQKKLKYMTTNISAEGDAKFVTEGKIDFMGVPAVLSAADFSPELDTSLKFAALTQCKGRQDIDAFPLNGPYYTSSGPNVDLRGAPSRERGACIPVATEYQDRVYTPFLAAEVPEPIRSVYTFGPQNGVSTRQENRVKPTPENTGKVGGVGRPGECRLVGKNTYECN